MAELADEDAAFEAELQPALVSAEKKYEAFELQIMMSGKHDHRSALVTIKPGAGGTDACDWAEMLFRAYKMWAAKHGFDVPKDDIDIEPNLEAGYASVSFKVEGPYAYGYMQSEIGVHRLVRISPFGGGDTRQTSFAAVDVLPELPDDIEIVIKDTGVRLIHKSGIRAECRMGRSQHKNKAEALKMLQARLEAVEEQKRMGDAVKSYDAKGEIAFGSQIRSYVLQPYTLVREERDGIDVKTPAVQDVLDGDFDQFMHAFLRHKSAKANRVKK
jgi:peptide chain release factor 2